MLMLLAMTLCPALPQDSPLDNIIDARVDRDEKSESALRGRLSELGVRRSTADHLVDRMTPEELRYFADGGRVHAAGSAAGVVLTILIIAAIVVLIWYLLEHHHH